MDLQSEPASYPRGLDPGLNLRECGPTEAECHFLVQWDNDDPLALQSRLPSLYGWRRYAEARGLMAYRPSLPDIHYRAASYENRLLKAAKPADLPVEQPTKFEFVINLKTAEALGLTIPPSLLF
jgi:hypothetical protein